MPSPRHVLVRASVWLDDVWLDVRYACRVILANRAFTLAAIATVALGVGASSAIFSVVYGISMRPLPYPDPGRLVRIYEANPKAGDLRHDVSIGAFGRWRDSAASVESAALFAKPGKRYLAVTDSVPVRFMSVSPAFFDVLGIRPALGPGFRPEREYTTSTADNDIVVSYAAWQRLFGGRRDAIGQTLAFTGVGDDDVYRVVGVMPATFAFAEPVDVWRPSLIVEPRMVRVLGWRYDRVVARLRQGATLEHARVELEAAANGLAREYPATSAGWTITIEPLHDAIVGAFSRASWLLLVAATVVLLVVCVNLGNLLVARAITRERETAVRIAIGAGAWRLARLWLAEASLVATAGAGVGLLLAWWAISALKAAAPPGIPRLDALDLDWPVFAVASASALLAIVTSASAPLGIVLRRDAISGLRAASTGAAAGTGRRALRTALTSAQCAGAAALVVLALMLTRSFVRLTATHLGWNPAGVLSLKIDPPMPRELRRPWARYVEWSDRLIARLESTPGIEHAAITSEIPLSTGSFGSTIGRGPGKEAGDVSRWPGIRHIVSDGYFETMNVGQRRGRRFDARDRFSAPQLVGDAARASGVAIVSESTARTLWPGREAIGEALWLPDIDIVPWREVIGVVEDTQFGAVGEPPPLQVYVPWTQFPTGNPRLVVKGIGPAAALAPLVKEIAVAVEPGTHVDQVQPLDALVARATAQPRFTAQVVSLFGVLALVLASVGVYGTLSHVVRAAAREIGIRMALGASRSDMAALTLRRGLLPAAVGTVVGTSAAVAVAHLFRNLFFEITPLDARSIAAGVTLLMLSALAAAIGPARRAAGLDPARTLQAE
jgi:putative ABC transport system permease protein